MIWVWLLAITLPLLPDPALTPGDVLTINTHAVCTPGYAGKTRDVSLSKKLSVYEAYALMPSGRWRVIAGVRGWQSDFEVDHLIPLQLGGSNDTLNLWPQSYLTTPYNAGGKDMLENRLHWLVCHGKLALTLAQELIRGNWTVAYDLLITNRFTP